MNTRRYLIQVTDAQTREVVVFTSTDWTAEQRQINIATILRLAGLPEESYLANAAEHPPSKDSTA